MSCRNVPAILLCWGNPGWGRTLETRVQLSKHQESRTGHGSNSALKAVLYLLKAPCFRNKFLRNCCLLYSYNPGCSARHGALCAFVLVVSDSLQPHRLQPARPLCPWDSPGKKAGAGCHFLLRGVVLTQGSNQSLFSTLAGGCSHHRARSRRAAITRQQHNSPQATAAIPIPALLGTLILKRKLAHFHVNSRVILAKKKLSFFFWLQNFYFIYLFIFFICGGFCHTLKWNSHGFTCVPHPDHPSHLPLHRLPLCLPSAPGPSACLMHPTWWSVSP